MAQTRNPPHRQLSRLQIGTSPAFGSGPQSAGLPGPSQFPPGQPPQSPFFPNVHSPMTPGPNGFFPPPQSRPIPPHIAMHRANPSLAHLAASGHIPLPPTPGPMQSFGGPPFGMPIGRGAPFIPLPASPGPNGPVGFRHHNRRTASISVGGPPKAILGGPKPKPVVNPDGTTTEEPAIIAPPATAEPPKPKLKKVTVNIPVETPEPSDGRTTPPPRPPWARYPSRELDSKQPESLPLLDITTAVPPPDTQPFALLPSTIEVYLPGQLAWTEYKNEIVEAKLAKLGLVDTRSSQTSGTVSVINPHNAQLHGRAASISTPADPTMLAFKLNNLQQQQGSATPPSPSPFSEAGSVPGAFGRTHGHSMSLAPTSSGFYSPSLSASPFQQNMSIPDPNGAFHLGGMPHPHLLGVHDFVPPHLKRSPLGSSSLRSVSVSEVDEEEEEDVKSALETQPEEDEDDEAQYIEIPALPMDVPPSTTTVVNAPTSLPLHAPQALTPIRPRMFQAALQSIAAGASSRAHSQSNIVDPTLAPDPQPVSATAPVPRVPTPPTAKPEQPNYALGFGLDAPSESGDESEHGFFGFGHALPDDDFGASVLPSDYESVDELDDEVGNIGWDENGRTPSHSRHVSRVSASSVRKAAGRMLPGGDDAGSIPEEHHSIGETTLRAEPVQLAVGTDEKENIPPPTSEQEIAAAWRHVRAHSGAHLGQGFVRAHQQAHPRDREEEWTNPSQLHTADGSMAGEEFVDAENGLDPQDFSDTMSTGEWSNPSDEEREREMRRVRRVQRAQQVQLQQQQPRLNVAAPVFQPSFGLSHVPPTFPQPTYQPTLHHAATDDDDIVSNPSDEGRNVHDASAYYSAPEGSYLDQHNQLPILRPTSGASNHGPYFPRPLPALPDSRVASATATPSPSQTVTHSRSASIAAKEKLNPNAKPFTLPGIPPSAPVSALPAPVPQLIHPDHRPPENRGPPNNDLYPRGVTSPQSSITEQHGARPIVGINSRLNAAASEFKPSFAVPDTGSGFTFKPPPGVPALSFPTEITPRPLPQLPPPSPRAAQGREKRQRRESGGNPETPSDDLSPNVEHLTQPDGESLAPNPRERRPSVLNPSAKPFAFGHQSGASNDEALQVPLVVTSSSAPATVPASVRSKRSVDDLNDEDERGYLSEAFRIRTSTPPVPSRPPIPDFRHPISTNTVPASLFKALVNADGEGPTRPTVRSRMDSRDFFDTHTKRGSLDDINLPSIARRVKHVSSQPTSSPLMDVFVRSETPEDDLPLASERSTLLRLRQMSTSRDSPPSPDIRPHRSDELHALETRILLDLDEKFATLRDTMRSIRESPAQIDSHMRMLLDAVVPELRAVQRANDSGMDAQGELDYEVIHNLIEHGHHELRASLQRDIAELAQGLETQSLPQRQIYKMIEEYGTRTIGSLNSATSNILAHFDASVDVARRQPQEERQHVVKEILHQLVPHINSLRQEPLDVDHVTARLTQAVKPHISQLIDLASDKKETAALIVQQLAPVLREMAIPKLDAAALGAQISSSVAVAVPRVDTDEIRETIADLVLERLDSRMTLRDTTFHNAIKGLQSHLSDTLTPHLTQLDGLTRSSENLTTKHEALSTQNTTLHETLSELASRLNLLPDTLTSATWAVTQAQVDLAAKSRQVEDLQKLQEVVAVNVELQQQLAKARSSHGQVRSEKDVLEDRFAQAEVERTAQKELIAELRAAVAASEASAAAAEARAARSEDSLAQILKKLEGADVSLASKDAEIARLEESQRTLNERTSDVESKLHSAELEVRFAIRDLEAAKQARIQVEAERDNLRSQQSHWKDLRRTADHLETLSKLVGNSDRQEIQELQRFRDRSKTLEGELAALQKIHAESDAKLGNLQKATMTAKQNLSLAQQRTHEAERQAKECEHELESCRFKLDQSEQARKETEAELESYKMQVEQHDVTDRANKERENQLKNQVSSLESQLLDLRAKLEKAQATAVKAAEAYPTPRKSYILENTRPSSRMSSTSTEYPSRPGTATPVKQQQQQQQQQQQLPQPERPRMAMPPPASVQSSMHAPSKVPSTPRPAHATPQPSYYAPSGVSHTTQLSPTLSTVSLAPTLDADGWWT